MRLALLSPAGVIEVVNKVWEDYFPRLGGDVGCRIGEVYADYWRSEKVRGRVDGDEAIRGIEAVLRQETKIFSWEYELPTRKGRRWYRLVVSPLVGGIQTGAMVMQGDITERKKTEEAHRLADEKITQMQRLDAIGQLTGGVAHDFNNLLTVIMGKAELLQDSLDEADGRRRWADDLFTAAERGATLTQRLLAFARRQALQPRRVDVVALLESTTALLRRSLGEHIGVVLPEDRSPRFVRADAPQLENVVINLCVNARDAMPNGGTITFEVDEVVVTELEATRSPDVTAGRYIRIAVADTGDGMDEATAQRCFEPFFTTKAVGKGTGLGLSMVYGFAKQSMGSVALRSTPGNGTRVILLLPRSDDLPQAATEAEEETAPNGSGEHVLIVEDNPMVSRHVTEQIASLGYRVRTASNAAEALATIESADRIDLLFTDIVLSGGMNGLELVEAARALKPDLHVLLTSGYAEALEHAARSRFTESLLAKPYRKLALARKLHAALAA